jgi:hypothetical protein
MFRAGPVGPFRLSVTGRGGGLVVVAGVTTRFGVRESRTQGEGGQQVVQGGYCEGQEVRW